MPEEIRREFSLEPGSRLTLWVVGNTLDAGRVRGVNELRGCLKSEVPIPGHEEERQAVAELRSEYYAYKHRQP